MWENTTVIVGVSKDLANQVQFTRHLADQTTNALQKYTGRLKETDAALTNASQQITALAQSPNITTGKE
jgi:hypothetical protein